MPRKDGWVPTESYLRRNRWLNKTSGIAKRRLANQFSKEYQKILNQVRREYPEPEA